MNEINPPAVVIEAQASLADLARAAVQEHEACESTQRASVGHARKAGLVLLEAKKRVGHGKFLPWLRANVPFAERTAQAYMRLARHWPKVEGKAQRVADLSFREALALIGRASKVRETLPAADEWLPPSQALGLLAELNEELSEASRRLSADQWPIFDADSRLSERAAVAMRMETAALRSLMDEPDVTVPVLLAIEERAGVLQQRAAENHLECERIMGGILNQMEEKAQRHDDPKVRAVNAAFLRAIREGVPPAALVAVIGEALKEREAK
jgi:hypothetical protein